MMIRPLVVCLVLGMTTVGCASLEQGSASLTGGNVRVVEGAFDLDRAQSRLPGNRQRAMEIALSGLIEAPAVVAAPPVEGRPRPSARQQVADARPTADGMGLRAAPVGRVEREALAPAGTVARLDIQGMLAAMNTRTAP